jgi:hypothetical protein
MGGPSRTACLTMQGIVASSTSQVLYAMANTALNQFRVGFVSDHGERCGEPWGRLAGSHIPQLIHSMRIPRD